MRFKNVTARALAFLCVALTAAGTARAQEEGVPVVLDEPVVQVNNDVIMLSTLRRENQEFRNVLTQQRGLTPQQADAQIAEKQPEILLNLINEVLLLQKGKDTPGVQEGIEAEVNREVLRVARESGINTIEELEAQLRQQGQSLSDIKETLRRQFTRQAVLQREVDYKIYFALTDAELQDYYNKNRQKFQSITISEIFLSLAGRSDAEVQAKARQIIAEARSGKDFGELAVKHSEREQGGVRVAEKTRGRIEDDGKPRWFLVSEMSEAVRTAVKDLKAGGVSEPIKVDEGYMILRVNERDDSFKENFVRGTIAQERSDAQRVEYLRNLRREAYIKPAENYKDVIQPLLDKDKSQTASGQGDAAKSDKGKKQ